MTLSQTLGRGLIAVFALLAAVFGSHALVGAADMSAQDLRVQTALSLLAATPATERLPSVLEANHVDVHFVPMAPGVYARYSVARHVIDIDDRWTDAEPVTLAAVIAHEATHAQDAVTGLLAAGGGPACIDSEVRAFRASAAFWLSQFGAAGKPGPTNELERQLNAIAQQQAHNPLGLEAVVRQTYSQQCSH